MQPSTPGMAGPGVSVNWEHGKEVALCGKAVARPESLVGGDTRTDSRGGGGGGGM